MVPPIRIGPVCNGNYCSIREVLRRPSLFEPANSPCDGIPRANVLKTALDPRVGAFRVGGGYFEPLRSGMRKGFEEGFASDKRAARTFGRAATGKLLVELICRSGACRSVPVYFGFGLRPRSGYRQR